MKKLFLVGAAVLILACGACSWKLGAEKLEAEGRTARKEPPPIVVQDVSASRQDKFIVKRFYS